MELELDLLWGPSEDFEKPERSHQVEGAGSLETGESQVTDQEWGKGTGREEREKVTKCLSHLAFDH